MQQVLFRFQLQPFLINWLLSSLANQGCAFDQWPHITIVSHIQRHNSERTFSFSFILLSCLQTHTSTGTKPVWSMPTWPECRICIISCSVAWIDCKDKMISEGIFHAVIFCISSQLEFVCKEKHEFLHVSVCDLSFYLQICNRYVNVWGALRLHLYLWSSHHFQFPPWWCRVFLILNICTSCLHSCPCHLVLLPCLSYVSFGLWTLPLVVLLSFWFFLFLFWILSRGSTFCCIKELWGILSPPRVSCIWV